LLFFERWRLSKLRNKEKLARADSPRRLWMLAAGPLLPPLATLSPRYRQKVV